MIISHKHKLIFIKTHKTAGTSIEVFLSKLCSDDDIVTPFGKPEPGHIPRNHEGFWNHMLAKDVIAAAGMSLWSEYFTFCVERNPWDKTISHYHFQNNRFHAGQLTFDEYIRNADFPSDIKSYTEGGPGNRVIIVDKILLYEDLEAELNKVMNQLGIDATAASLPTAKSHYRADRRHYRDVLTASERSIIEEFFSEEIQLFEYEY